MSEKIVPPAKRVSERIDHAIVDHECRRSLESKPIHIGKFEITVNQIGVGKIQDMLPRKECTAERMMSRFAVDAITIILVAPTVIIS